MTGNTAGAGDGGNKKEAAQEDVRGLTKTGVALTFHLPQKDEAGVDTWGSESEDRGRPRRVEPERDEQLGYVYIPLTAPTASAFGGWRPGDNLYRTAWSPSTRRPANACGTSRWSINIRA